MTVNFLKTLLADPLNHPVQRGIPLVQLHMNIVPEPHPAAPFLRRFSPRTVENMVPVKTALISGNEALPLILQD